MAAGGTEVVGIVTALAAAASAGAAVYSATKKPDIPKPPKLPALDEKKPVDTGGHDRQRRQAAAAAVGRQSTLLTGPQGLGSVGSTGQPRSTLLGL